MTTTLAKRADPNGRGNEVATSSSVEAVRAAIDQLKALRTFVSEEMKKDVDYGVIPGTGTKPTLYLPGAQKTALYYNVTAIITHVRTELGGGHLEVVSTCRLKSRQTRQTLAMGSGSCATMESKYRWRSEGRSCPNCKTANIKVSKPEYGGGFYCHAKTGGCGAKFRDDDPRITGQSTGRVENPDVYDQRNTVLKMAAKRAQVAAALNLGAMAELFTQDIEDIYNVDVDVAPAPAAPAPDRKADVNRDFPPPEHLAKDNPNDTGHGSGAYAAPAVVAAYKAWLKDFVSDINQQWLDRYTDAQGTPAGGLKGELLRTFGVSGHLIKAGRAAGLLNAPEQPKPGQLDRFAAILWDRDREATIAEAKAYARREWRLEAAKMEPHPEDESQENPDDGDPDTDLPREPGSDDDLGD